MNIKNTAEIVKMRKSGQIAASILDKLIAFTKVGIQTIEIEKYSEKLLKLAGVKGAFKNYNDYPFNTCISINDEVVHGMPGNRVIKNSDVISIDFGVIYEGFCSDMAKTFVVGKYPQGTQKLLRITKLSLDNAIKLIKPGAKLGNIQHCIENTITRHRYGLVRDLTGHFIGKNLQEKPSIPNFARPNTGIILKPGMIFCLEPMVTLGDGSISIKDDGWTIISADHTLSAHFEHTILVTENGYEILTNSKY